MRLLISAYACAPNRGSEHAVGWNWATEAYRLGHEVCVLASPAHRGAIDAACTADPALQGIHWVFPEVRAWPLQPAIEPRWERTYNLLWQRAALHHARALHAEMRFDAVHHLTWGGIRAPTFLGALGVPLIVGPIGGGETSPPALRDQFGLKARLAEKVRDLSNATITINPVVRHGLASAAVIFVKTAETNQLLTRAMRRRSATFLELGVRGAEIGKPRRAQPGPPRLLYAGRLLYWKGVHIAIQSLADLVHRMPDARLTIVGMGPEEQQLRADAEAYRLEANIDFIPWLPQAQLFDLYSTHNLLIFPSLHDSSGNVVLEALSRGLPVICLDLGGPRYIVTPKSGIIVSTVGRNTRQVAAAIADEVVQAFVSPTRLSDLSAGAIARARQFVLHDRVAELYDSARAFINPSNETVDIREGDRSWRHLTLQAPPAHQDVSTGR
jgi:glycosyltransferase involved in cell wall biosynthesis